MSLLLSQLGGRTANASITEGSDTLSAAAALSILASSGLTESSDTLSSTSALAINAALTATESPDTLSSAAALRILAAAEISEAADSVVTAAVLPIRAALSTTEGADTLSGIATLAIQADASINEAGDTLNASGSEERGIVAEAALAETADTLFAQGALSSTEIIQKTGGSYNFLNPRRYRIADEEEREELRKEIIKIGTAAPQEVVTGIVDIPRRRRANDTRALDRINRARALADMASAEKLKRIIAADDEWLMTA